MSDCQCEAETIEKINTVKEEFLYHDIDGESLDDYYSQNILRKLLVNGNARETNIAESQISDKNDIKIESIASVEDQPIQINKVEGLVLDKDKHSRKTFDETVDQFKLAFQSPIAVNSKENPKLIPKEIDKRKSIEVDDNYNNATQDNIGDEVELCSKDDKVENNKDVCCEKDLPREEKINFTEISESSDEECTKKSKLFTFTDDDIPDSNDITEILMSYPKPTFKECFSELEQIEDSYKEIYRFLRRPRNKLRTDRIGDLTNPEIIEKLPQRVITRQRKVPVRFGNTNKYLESFLQSRYIKVAEDQIDSEIIMENIRRLKRFAKEDKYKYQSISRKNNNSHDDNNKMKVEKDKPDRKVAKSKSTTGRKVATSKKTNNKTAARAQANVESRLRTTSISKSTPRSIRSMKNENDGKNTVNKSKHTMTIIKKTSTLPKIRGRQSKRQKERSSRKMTDNKKSKDPKEKIIVNIEKLEKKNTKTKSKFSVRMKVESLKNTTKEDSLDSTLASKTTTRSKKKEAESQNIEKDPENKRKRTNKIREKESLVSPNIIVRRNKRQKTVKKENQEQSTVNNISSSRSESPRSLKRSMVDDSDMPSTKRTRSHNASSNSGINNASLRATPVRVMKTQPVLLPSKQKPDTRGPFVHLLRLTSSHRDSLRRRAGRGNS